MKSKILTHFPLLIKRFNCFQEMDNPSGSDTYLNKIKGLDGLFHKSWSLLIKTFLKSFSSKPSNTVVLIMRMKRRQFVVFSWYNSFVFQIKETILAAFQEAFSEVRGGYEKIRFKGLDYESAHVYGEKAPQEFLILENGVSYQVFLNDGLMTGIFLDQHEVRGSLVDGIAAGQSLLNMFSYTAAFSVAAAMGGAVETTSVDLAKRSRELSEAHFVANGLALDAHRFVVMDVFDYYKYAKRHDLSYDVIVLDPPSFARNKKRTFSVAKDYHRLVSEALEILNPGGTLILSTNAANVTKDKFKKQIEKGFQGRKHRYVAEYGLPGDFRWNKKEESSNYLKVFTIRVDV